MKQSLSKVLGLASALVALGALARELRSSRANRRWHGRILGVPYDFRRPTRKRVRKAWWSPKDDRLLTPRAFGVGWAVNLGRVWRLVAGR